MILAERRSQPRRDDLLDTVVFGEIDGVPVDEKQSFAMLILLLMGGLSTTSAALATMIEWLADHPEDVVRLREHPELHNLAVDEFVRYSSPVAHIGRTVTTDTEVEGCPLPKGSRVLLGFGSANRDEQAFQRADEVLDRPAAEQAPGLRDRPAPLHRVARGQAGDQGRPRGASRCHAPLPCP